MTTKEYLQQIRKNEACINQKMKELSSLRTTLVGIKGIDYSRERVQSGGYISEAGYAGQVNKFIDMQMQLNSEINNLIDEKYKITKMIQSLDSSKHVEILIKVYVDGKGLITIAKEMGYSYQYVRRMHGEALVSFERSYKKLQNDTTQAI